MLGHVCDRFQDLPPVDPNATLLHAPVYPYNVVDFQKQQLITSIEEEGKVVKEARLAEKARLALQEGLARSRQTADH